MADQSLSISFGLDTDGALQDPYWLNMEVVKEETEDGMSVGEAAAIIDNLYQIDPCATNADPYNTQGNNPVAEEPPDEDIWAAILAQYSIPSCDMAGYAIAGDVGGYDAQIKVFRSHPGTEVYRLRLSNGSASGPRRIREVVTHDLDIEEDTYVVLDNPIIGRPVVAWLGVDGPSISINRNTLHWDGKFTGTIRAEFETEYDLINIHVHGEPTNSEIIEGTLPENYNGTGWYSGSDDGSELEDVQSIECSVLAFYHYQYEELILTNPDPEDDAVTGSTADEICNGTAGSVVVDPGGTGSGFGPDRDCYQAQEVTEICKCSHETTVKRETERVDCPDTTVTGTTLEDKKPVTRFIDCDETDEVNDPAFYEEKCCHPWPFDFPMPICREVYGPFSGGGEGGIYNPDIRAQYEADYENIVFIAVNTETGTCGEQVLEQDVDTSNCCEGVLPLVFIPENNPTVMADYSQELIVVDGGGGPFLWSVSDDEGAAYFLKNGKKVNKVENFVGSVWLYSDDICGSIKVTVEDSCDQSADYSLRASEGGWTTVDYREWDGYDFSPWSDDVSCESDAVDGDPIDPENIDPADTEDTVDPYNGYTRRVVSGSYRVVETAYYTGYWNFDDATGTACHEAACGSGRRSDPVEAYPPCWGMPDAFETRDMGWLLSSPGVTDCLQWDDGEPCIQMCGDDSYTYSDHYGVVTCGTATYSVFLWIRSRRWEVWSC